MASGKKNYFRHSFFARNDAFVIKLMEKMGHQGYFLWFALLEICGEIASDQDGTTFKLHNSRLLRELRCRQDKLDSFLALAEQELRLSCTRVGQELKIDIFNFPKYLGFYLNKIPKETKLNQIKEKEIKLTQTKEKSDSEFGENIGHCEDENKKNKSLASMIKFCYSLAYEKKYKLKPIWTISENSLAEKLIQLVGQEEAKKLAAFYPTFLDRWHSEQKHPFHLLIFKIDQIRIAMNTNSSDIIINPYTVARKKLKESKLGIQTEFAKDDL